MNVGEIEYTVAIETEESIKAADKSVKSLDKIEKNMKSAEKSADKFNRSLNPIAASIRKAFGRDSTDSVARVKNELSGLVSIMGRVAAAAGIVMSASAFGGMIKKNIDLAHSTLDVAEKLGTTTEALSKLRYAASQTAGMGAQEFDIALQRMTRRLAEAAEGGGVAKDAIRELGLSAQELSKQGPDQAFKMIMEQMSKLPDQADRVRLAFKFFDSGGVKLAQTAKGGATAVDELGKSLEDMGGVISTEMAQQSAELNGKLEEMQARFAAVGMKVAGEALPSMQQFVNLLNDPSITSALSDIASGLVKLGEWAITGAANVAKAMKWIGEEIAILQGGIGLHDTARLEEQYKQVSKNYEKLKKEASDYAKHTDTLAGKLKNAVMAPSAEMVENARLKMLEVKQKLDASRKLFSEEISKDAGQVKPQTGGIPLGPSASQLTETTKAAKQQRDANADLIKSLELVAATMGMSKEEATLYKMAADGATDAQLTHAASLLETIKVQGQAKEAQDNYEAQIKSIEESLRLVGLEGLELMQVQAELALGEYATEEQIRKVRELTAELYNAQEAAKLDDLLGQYDKGHAAQSDFDQKMEDLNMLLEAQKISEDEYREYTLNAERELKDQLMMLDQERFEAQSLGNKMLMKSLDSVKSHAADAFIEFASGAKSGSDAAKALGQAIGQSVIKALVDMGVQMAVNAVKEKLFAAQSAATAATTGAAITAAYTPAAAAASIASFGGAAVTGMAAMAAAIPAMMSMFGGGREHGGPVDPSKFYRVNEGGKPELLNVGNKQYLMPNQRGEVVSNADATAGSGGGGVTINVHESPRSSVTVDTQQQPDGSYIVDVIVNDMMAGGRTSDALQSGYGLQRAGV